MIPKSIPILMLDVVSHDRSSLLIDMGMNESLEFGVVALTVASV